mmetsp:Transcript_86729/g.185812  ORF Transcript_86729/g.185812 Transcript_86729/m.185812 type:complete len:663 (+) Transcript_86729:93-2081(+)
MQRGGPGYSRAVPPYSRGPPTYQQGPSVYEVEAAFDRKLADIVQQVETNLRSIEARLANFESLQEAQQQVQAQQGEINKLTEVTTALSQDIAGLRRDHGELGGEQAVLRESLLGAGVLQVSQLQKRRHAGSCFALLRTALNDRGILGATRELLGDRGASLARLAATGTAFVALKSVAKAPTGEAIEAKAKPTSLTLDRDQWNKIKDYEPSPTVMDKWAESVTVHTALGHAGIEGTIGKTDSMKFNTVLKIFGQIGLSTDRFVSKFTIEHCDRDTPVAELNKTALEILRMFAARHPAEALKESMHCRDLYRLLEIIGYSLKRFKSIFNANDDGDDTGAQSSQRFGSYKVRRQVCQTHRGVGCYLAEHVTDLNRVAVKWPVPRSEVVMIKEIHEKAKAVDCVGLPALLASGDFEGSAYIVTDLLGSSMNKVFHCLHNYPIKRRWQAIQILGRLSVRRLRGFHMCGYVHNDISPENILLGPVRAPGEQPSATRLGLYLIDFEHARKSMSGQKLEMDLGSAEWSSVRSAEGGEPLPQDDLEAIGWVLLNGLVGALPWFEWLVEAYKDWDSKWTRHAAVRQVQRAKIQLLEEGWAALDWKEPVTMRAEAATRKLLQFIKDCRLETSSSKLPRYDLLTTILGGNIDLSSEDAEKLDLDEFAKIVLPML